MQEAHDVAGSVVMRTWFFQSYQNGDPNNFSQFDAVLNAAAAHGIMVVPVLANEWGACEYDRPYHPLAWYQGGYLTPDPGYALSFKDYAVRMAARYAGDPRIAFWQLVNEAETKAPDGTCDNTAGESALRSFADDVTTAIKQVDPNHLVSLGTMGGGQCGTQGAAYQYVHAGLVDLCEVHDYWGANNEGDQWNGFAVRQQQCAALNKPLFVGEGALSDSGTQRASEFNTKFAFTFNGGGAGFLIWTKGTTGPYDVPDGDPTEAEMLSWAQQFAPPTPTPTPLPATSTVLVASSSTPTVGDTITLTATVSAAAGIPDGAVNFIDGATSLGSVTLDPIGAASITTPALTVGQHTFSATYAGSAGFAGSSTQLVEQASQASTATAVASTSTASASGQRVTFTATVAPGSTTAGTPTGTVAFTDGGAPISGCAAQSLMASLIASCAAAPSAGVHAIAATYSGDANFTGSAGQLTQTVGTATTSTAVSSTVNPVASNQAVTYAAAVVTVAPGAGTPAGYIEFADGGQAISTCAAVPLNASATATCTVTYAAPSAHSIVAVYSGDANDATSASSPLSETALGALNSGAQPMAFWLGRTGQGILTGGSSSGGVCKSGTWLRTYHPFQDLKSSASCSSVASYVSTVVKASAAAAHTSNALLKSEMLAVALDVYFGGGYGGTKFSTPHGAVGALNIDVTHVCGMVDSSSATGVCSGVFASSSTAFGGAMCTTVLKLLVYENNVSNSGGSTWYAQNLALQGSAKDTFDSIANQAAFIC